MYSLRPLSVATTLALSILVIFSITPAVSESEPERVETLYVESKETDCLGPFERKCLIVRRNFDGPKELFYNPIEGFERVDGTSYTLVVGISGVNAFEPQADDSSLHYRLIGNIGMTTTTPAARTENIYVGPQLTDCVNPFGTNKCMIIRRCRNCAEETFDGPIDGFWREDGTAYAITIRVSKIDNPPQDASSESYSLISVRKMWPREG